MNKQEFLSRLEKSLKNIPQADTQDIISDYTEHFSIGESEGKSEEDISQALGNPEYIGKLFKADYMVDKASSSISVSTVLKAVLAFISLSFFNLIVVAGPFLLALGILIGLWGLTFGIVFSGGAGMIASILFPFTDLITLPVTGGTVAFVFFLSMGILFTGILALIAMFYITKWFLIGTLKYLKFNLELITKEV